MTANIEHVPTVVIVGRPNVGKSSLFNRLVRKRRAITLDTPGVTRDPIGEEVVWEGRRLRIIDTGGLGGERVIDLAERVHRHTLATAKGADLAIVVLDAKAGATAIDRDTIDTLVRLGVPALFVANKTDGPRELEALVDFCVLGIDVPLGVSAEHGIGLGELRAAVLERLFGKGMGPTVQPATERSGATGDACRVAIVGRPNVGKSSLLNRLAGQALALVDATPGTTRDAVDTLVEHHGRRFLFVDTAGMRRPSRIDENLERLSVRRSLEAVRRADVVLLLIEPREGMTDQDARIARIAWEEGRALLIAINKADLAAPGPPRATLTAALRHAYPTLAFADTMFLSATTGEGIERLFAAIEAADRAHAIEVRTTDLNRILSEVARRREPPVIGRGRLRLLYITQTASRPPTFTIFANRDTVPRDYVRFIERCLREALPLRSTPVRLRFRKRDSHGLRQGSGG